MIIPDKLVRMAPYIPAEGASEVRLDANESFIAPSEELCGRIQSAVSSVDLRRYPDPEAKELCRRAARVYGVGERNIVAGNGSDELISVIISVFSEKGSTVLVNEPDFSMYAFYCAIAEARCACVPQALGGDIDTAAMLEAAKREKASIVIFSNPCNPTGQGVEPDRVLSLARALDCLVVVDEAYMDFWGRSILPELPKNVIVLKTCSKALGLAALRLGFAIGREELVGYIKKAKSPFNVNALSQAAASAAMENPALLENCAREILSRKEELHTALEGMSGRLCFELIGTKTNFVLIKTPLAEKLQKRLLDDGICVRHICGCLRVTAGSPEENRRFLKSFERIAGELQNEKS